ncbi:hypothetical protein FACS1894123_01680 [Bacteroidia bacterium]|nr:hypothetical protein FACS1894123_01680 [Bacteroidia bacterium]
MENTSKQLQIRNSTADFLIFTRQSGEDGIAVRVEDENVWLRSEAMAELFQKDRRTVQEHLKNVFVSGELDENSVCRIFRHTAEDGKIIKTDVSIAKNYLSKLELSELNEIVTMYLDYANRQARKFVPMTMEDWKSKLDIFLKLNDEVIGDGIGKITHEIAKAFAESEFEKYRVIQDKTYKSDFDKLFENTQDLLF